MIRSKVLTDDEDHRDTMALCNTRREIKESCAGNVESFNLDNIEFCWACEKAVWIAEESRLSPDVPHTAVAEQKYINNRLNAYLHRERDGSLLVLRTLILPIALLYDCPAFIVFARQDQSRFWICDLFNIRSMATYSYAQYRQWTRDRVDAHRAICSEKFTGTNFQNHSTVTERFKWLRNQLLANGVKW